MLRLETTPNNTTEKLYETKSKNEKILNDLQVETWIHQRQTIRAFFLIDTGAEISLIKEEVILNKQKINKQNMVALKGITEGKLFTLGECEMTLQINDGIMVHKFYVVSNEFPIRQSGILGRDFLTEKQIKIDFGRNILTIPLRYHIKNENRVEHHMKANQTQKQEMNESKSLENQLGKIGDPKNEERKRNDTEHSESERRSESEYKKENEHRIYDTSTNQYIGSFEVHNNKNKEEIERIESENETEMKVQRNEKYGPLNKKKKNQRVGQALTHNESKTKSEKEEKTLIKTNEDSRKNSNPIGILIGTPMIIRAKEEKVVEFKIEEKGIFIVETQTVKEKLVVNDCIVYGGKGLCGVYNEGEQDTYLNSCEIVLKPIKEYDIRKYDMTSGGRNIDNRQEKLLSEINLRHIEQKEKEALQKILI